MLYLNDKEEKIIGGLLSALPNYEQKEILLNWGDGNLAIGFCDTYIEDENDADIDSEDYEEFWSFVFLATKVFGHPPIYVTEDRYFLLNYHNFPDGIFVDGKKIN